MGNEKSKQQHGNAAASSKASSSGTPRAPPSPRTTRAFRALAGDDCEDLALVKKRDIEKLFGEDLGHSLWTYLSDGAESSASMPLEVFSKHFHSLVGNSTDIYTTFLTPPGRLLRLAASAAGADPSPGDAPFIARVVHKMTADGEDSASVVQWKHRECPRLLNALQGDLTQKLLGYGPDPTSRWTPLYTSAQQGISVSRFEANVFDYRGPTIAIISLVDGSLFVLGVDQEWRNSGTTFGGSDAVLYQLAPSLMAVDAFSSVYCNFKIRQHALGLHVKKLLDVDKDMSNVNAIEVWGCSGAKTLAEQQKLKQWQSRQVEKHKKVSADDYDERVKVPLPGNWEENPDKTLLEMAGFTFSTERRDERRRDD